MRGDHYALADRFAFTHDHAAHPEIHVLMRSQLPPSARATNSAASKALIFTLFSALLWGCASSGGNRSSDAPITSSPNDSNSYRALTLDNNLLVFLASDPESDKGAAAMTVFRGSYHDPDDRPGLAHFLEHMLFIGTEKYPDVDGYQHFISSRGGSSNAYTAGDHTNYFFDIGADHLEPALDRFAQFFVAPLLDPEYVEREANAVHSEYQLQLKDDNWRAQAVNRATSNPAHPYSGFNIGSLETLSGGDIHADVVAFFEANHSADQMALVVYGREDLDMLERYVVERFGAIENKRLGAAEELPELLGDEQLRQVLRYPSQRQRWSVSFGFPIEPMDPYMGRRPDAFVANLLGHEGDGSLHQWLKEQGWITSLAAGSARLDANNQHFNVSIELTPDGYEHIDDIGVALFDAIELIRQRGVKPRYFDEQASIAELNFNYREPSSATRFVYLTAPALMRFRPEEVLSATALMTTFDESAINGVLDRLTPENVVVEITSPDETGDQIEPWFKVPYSLSPFQLADRGEVSDAELRLPQPNPYLPTALELLEDDPTGPTLVLEQTGLQVWRDRDTVFGSPRQNTYIRIATASGNRTAIDQVASRIYAGVVSDSLTARLYPAELAGLRYGISAIDAGFQISIAGFSEQQLTLLASLVDALPTTEIDSATFERVSDRIARAFINEAEKRPYEQALGDLSKTLIGNRYDPVELAGIAQSMTRRDLEAWRSNALREASATVLLHGNVSAEKPGQTAELLQARLRLSDIKAYRPDVAAIDVNTSLERTVDHADSAMVLYVQSNGQSYTDQAKDRLAVHLLRTQYFTALRTEAQLGYIVIAAYAELHKQPGVAFVIQSPVATPQRLVTETLTFLEARPAAVDAMSETDFNAARSALVDDILEADQNLVSRGGRLWRDLINDELEFDSRETLAMAIKSINKADFARHMEALVKRAQEERLVITSPGAERGALDAT